MARRVGSDETLASAAALMPHRLRKSAQTVFARVGSLTGMRTSRPMSSTTTMPRMPAYWTDSSEPPVSATAMPIDSAQPMEDRKLTARPVVA